MEIAQADFETMQALRTQGGGQVSTLIVKFYPGDIIDEKASYGWLESKGFDPLGREITQRHAKPTDGRERYQQFTWIEIRAPGNKDEIRQRPMREEDKTRFPREWALYQRGMADTEGGTPLEVVPFLTKGQVLEFRAAGIGTVEQLAAVSDVDGQKFMGFNRTRQKAQDYLAAQEKGAPAAEMRAELEKRDGEIEALKEQVKALMEDRKKK